MFIIKEPISCLFHSAFVMLGRLKTQKILTASDIHDEDPLLLSEDESGLHLHISDADEATRMNSATFQEEKRNPDDSRLS